MGRNPKVGLVQFLGSNCDQDCIDAMGRHFGIELVRIWHTSEVLPELDGLILPGGFSYGDFLRGGSLASHTKIMSAVRDFAASGGAILGICNGFQILTESGLLPGALIRNESGKFCCRSVELNSCSSGGSHYHSILSGAKLSVPVAHGEGRYFINADGLARLHDNGQVLFRYTDNPNGSTDDIAGIVSENGRVLGMMPHPERACERALGGSRDGLRILGAFLEACL